MAHGVPKSQPDVIPAARFVAAVALATAPLVVPDRVGDTGASIGVVEGAGNVEEDLDAIDDDDWDLFEVTYWVARRRLS
jgi:hypothetical protein